MHFDSLTGWLNWQESLHPKSIDLGLERVARVYRALQPIDQKPPTVTVAGTNGKGSTVAFLESIYSSQGYRVGAYTSPHILRYNERIKVDGEPVDDVLICEAFERIEAVRGDISLSYFEFSTLAALDVFRRARVDVQILEVGLGGRLDAVNIVDTDAAIVTGICIDHCDWLGETREAIGKEKAGIFRSGKPAIIADLAPPATLLQCAKTIGARLSLLGQDYYYRKSPGSWEWEGAGQHLAELPYPNLKGEHQLRNASAALLAVATLQDILPVGTAAIRQGLAQTRLAGRFQLLDHGPVPVLLDVAHNPQAAATLLEHIRDNFPKRQVRALFAMMKDKDIKGVVEIMRPVVGAWYISPLGNPRTASPEAIRDICVAAGAAQVHAGFQNFAEAFAAAQNGLDKGDLIVVFGSFFLVSEYLSKFADN